MEDGLDVATLGSEADGADAEGKSVSYATTLKVGKQTYAVGLVWLDRLSQKGARKEASQHASSHTGRNALAQRHAVKTSQPSLFCVRSRSTAQLALGWREAGHKPGMPPLAAYIADNVPETFLGAFPVENGVYVVAINDGAILSEKGDQFFTDPEQAREALANLLAEAEWSRAYAPSDWGLPETLPADNIEEVLAGRPSVRLKALKGQQDLLVKGILAATTIGVGVYGYQMYFTPEPTDTVQKQVKKTKEPRTPHLFEARTKGLPVLKSCLERMRDVPLAYPGYHAEKVVCDGGQEVRVTLAQGSGTTVWVKDSLERRDLNATVSGTDTLTVTFPIEADFSTWGRIEDSRLPDLQTLKGNLEARARERFVDVQVAQQAGNENTRVLAFNLKDVPAIKPYLHWFKGIPAFTVQEVRWSVAGSGTTGHWSMKGQFHEAVRVPNDANR